jgi:hypothetical protein
MAERLEIRPDVPIAGRTIDPMKRRRQPSR